MSISVETNPLFKLKKTIISYLPIGIFSKKVDIMVFIFLLLSFYATSQSSQSRRETERLKYEQKIIQHIETLDFNDIPWMEVFQDGMLRPSEVKRVFEKKLAITGPENAKKKVQKVFKIYMHTAGNMESADRQFIWQDDKFESFKTAQKASNQRSSGPSSFTYAGQTNSVFNTGNGRIERVNFHPTNTNIIWASAPEGGLWKSTDAGSNWNVVDDFWDHQSVGDLVYNLNNYDTIYVATDDHDSFFNNNRGVLRSTDGGITWNIVGLPNSMANQVFKLAMAPDGRTLYACTTSGLFKSSDHGVTWIKNASLPASLKANDIEFHPTNPQVIYLTSRSGTDQHPIGGANTSYFYVSTNGGTTFTLVTCPLDSKGRPAQVSVSANNPDIAYISVYPDDEGLVPENQGGMIMKYTFSTNNIAIIVGPTFNFPLGNFSGAWDFRFEVNPSNANHLIYGCVNVHQSFDGGMSWQNIPSPHSDQHDFKWQNGTNRLWFADDGGLSYTTNGGSTWTYMKKIETTQYYSVRSSKYGKNFLGGLQDAGTQVNMNGHWFSAIGGDGLEVAVDPVDSFTVYGTVQNGQATGRITYNPNTQTSSTKIIMNQSIAGGFAGTWRVKVLIDAADHNTLYTNYRDIFKSTNKGDSWVNLTNGALGNGANKIAFIYQSKSNPNVLVAGWQFVLKRSTNGGATWNTVTYPPGNISYPDQTSLTFHPNDANTMWVCSGNKVQKTSNGGISWTDVPGTLPNGVVLTSIAYQDGTNNGFYVGGTGGNIWYHDDNIGDYVLFESGLPNVLVTEVEVLPHINKIRAATWGRGIWESPLYEPSVNFCNHPSPPNITQTVCATSSVMNISAAPSGYNIIWEKDGVLISGQNGTSYTATLDGVYRARYMANSGTCHSYYSDAVNVNLRPQAVLLNGKGLHFDGANDYLNCTSEINLNGKSFTVSLWAKRQNLNGFQTLINVGDQGALNTTLSLRFNSSNRLQFDFEGNALIAPTPTTDLDWHYWTCVYDKSISSPGHNRFIYMDGVLVASDRSNADFIGNGVTRIGSYAAYLQFFSGTIDDVKLWDIAKSSTQIRQEMFCSPECYTAEMKLFLPFSDGIAGGNNAAITSITDYSSYANHATLVNFTKTGNASNLVPGLDQFKAYTDNDGDGYGDGVISECYSGNWVNNDLDCNDNNVNIHPVAIEVCGNGVDENCNGVIDENTLSLDFDGTNDFVNCGNSLGNFGIGNFTIEMQIKTTVTSKVLISKRPGCNGSNTFWNVLINSSGKVLVEMMEANFVNSVNFSGNVAVNDNNWHHIAIVRSGSAISIFVDGSLDVSNNVPLTNLSNTANFVL
ncbi:MAG TPA: MopE-related protein, partial [Saprospiraceae bacterium]|nr:MopE-related protein [Saprospiraceae bacterium]